HETEPVLPARRSGCPAGRRQRGPLRPAARRVQGSDAVHRHHTQPAHHAGGRRRVRRHDAGARGLDDRGRAPGPDGTGVIPVPRSLRAAALFAFAFPAGLVAQRPAVSPVLARMWQRDTTLTVWLFVRPDVPLARGATRRTDPPRCRTASSTYARSPTRAMTRAACASPSWTADSTPRIPRSRASR